MITRFKIFENISGKYKEGDYILLDVNKIIADDITNLKKYSAGGEEPETYDNYALIIKIQTEENTVVDDYGIIKFPYKVQFPSGETSWVNGTEIVRHLTPEEIPGFEIKKVAGKYNL